MKVVTYNIQNGLGKDNRYDLTRIAHEAHRLAGGGTIQAVVDACRAAIAEAEAAVEPASA